MAAKFAEIFIKLGLKKEGFDKEVKKTSTSFKDMGKSMLKTGAIIGGVAAGAVIAGKAIWELGKSGAATIQLGESFDFLVEKVGAAPDLLDQLTEATLGTVDAGTLMASTLTLTAGAGDDLTKMMMEAAPQLARIAKAANKLNPTLGDTAFMYQSIGTGVKRAQPLILDNLGLTLKVGQANEDFAKSIGKTVEQLTAEEKAMAILNATLKAGDQLISQVGGTVDAATDDFERAETSIKNLKSSLYELAAAPVADIAEDLTSMTEGIIENVEWQKAYNEAMDKGIIVMGDYTDEVRQNNNTNLTAAEGMVWLEEKTEEYRLELNMTAEATGWAAGQDRELTSAKEDLTEAVDDTRDAFDKYTEAIGGAKDQLGVYQKAIKAVADSEAEALRMKLLLKLQTEDLTAAQIEDTLNRIDAIGRMEDLTQAFEDGRISELEFKGAISDGMVTQAEFNTVLGYTDDELHEVETGMGKTEDAADRMSGKFYSSTIPAVDDLKGSLFNANAQAAFLEEGLIAASGDYEARFTLFIETVGEFKLPKELGPPMPTSPYVPPAVTPEDEKKFRPWLGQHGLSFTVPSGYSNDSFFAPLALSSGEHVQVTPRGRGGGGGARVIYNRGGDYINIQNPAHAAMVLEQRFQDEMNKIDEVV